MHYDVHEPRALRQLPTDWRFEHPRRRRSRGLWLVAALFCLGLIAWLLIAAPLHI